MLKIRNCREGIPSAAKAALICGFYGPAEAAPFQSSYFFSRLSNLLR
jgi:hypothetical protein